MVRKLLSLFYSRRARTLQHGLRPQRAPDYFIIAASSIAQTAPGTYAGDITLVNWPQNDYMLGNLVDVSAAEAARHLDRAKQLSLSWLYWLQTECPRPDGGTGWKGLRLRPDIVGTEDGLAKYPYIRESRRIKAEFTVTELHVGTEARMQATGAAAAVVTAAEFADSVGIGSYNIDLHPSSTGENYIDFGTRPSKSRSGRSCRRMENLLPACKNIGTTHLTNGCYRLHPVEWNIGESVGELAAFAPSAGTPRGPCEKTRAARGLPGPPHRGRRAAGLAERRGSVLSTTTSVDEVSLEAGALTPRDGAIAACNLRSEGTPPPSMPTSGVVENTGCASEQSLVRKPQ